MALPQSRRARERGAATTSFMTLVTVLILSFGLVVNYRLSRGTDQAGQLQSAADSAALAGAEAVRSNSWGAFVSALAAGKNLDTGLGQDAAIDVAQRNAAKVLTYQYRPETGIVSVTVQSAKVLESGHTEERTAYAQVG